MKTIQSPSDPERLAVPIASGNVPPSKCGCTSYSSRDKNFSRIINDKPRTVKAVWKPTKKFGKIKINKAKMVSKAQKAITAKYKDLDVSDFTF